MPRQASSDDAPADNVPARPPRGPRAGWPDRMPGQDQQNRWQNQNQWQNQNHWRNGQPGGAQQRWTTSFSRTPLETVAGFTPDRSHCSAGVTAEATARPGPAADLLLRFAGAAKPGAWGHLTHELRAPLGPHAVIVFDARAEKPAPCTIEITLGQGRGATTALFAARLSLVGAWRPYVLRLDDFATRIWASAAAADALDPQAVTRVGIAVRQVCAGARLPCAFRIAGFQIRRPDAKPQGAPPDTGPPGTEARPADPTAPVTPEEPTPPAPGEAAPAAPTTPEEPAPAAPSEAAPAPGSWALSATVAGETKAPEAGGGTAYPFSYTGSLTLSPAEVRALLAAKDGPLDAALARRLAAVAFDPTGKNRVVRAAFTRRAATLKGTISVTNEAGAGNRTITATLIGKLTDAGLSLTLLEGSARGTWNWGGGRAQLGGSLKRLDVKLAAAR